MAMTIDNLDTLIERTVRSAIDIAHRVDWDFREAERLAKEQAKAAGKGEWYVTDGEAINQQAQKNASWGCRGLAGLWTIRVWV